MARRNGWMIGGVLAVVALLGGLASTDGLRAQEHEGAGRLYEVTITNLTRGQQLTPRLVVVHRPGLRLFDLGEAPSLALAQLAEQGDTAPFTSLLSANAGVRSVATTGGLLNPGETERFHVTGRPGDGLSVAAMLIPTNDGFFAVQGLQLPRLGQETASSPVYDAGSERNDELCASVPGPGFAECGGPGGGAVVGGGEGFVHIHAGIHGIGNLSTAERDWRNPAVRVAVRMVR